MRIIGKNNKLRKYNHMKSLEVSLESERVRRLEDENNWK